MCWVRREVRANFFRLCSSPCVASVLPSSSVPRGRHSGLWGGYLLGSEDEGGGGKVVVVIEGGGIDAGLVVH